MKTIIDYLKYVAVDTHEEYLSKLDFYKELIDKSPDKFLQFHLDNCIKWEQYELAQYIKDKM